jgi:hypothetical protein
VVGLDDLARDGGDAERDERDGDLAALVIERREAAGETDILGRVEGRGS